MGEKWEAKKIKLVLLMKYVELEKSWAFERYMIAERDNDYYVNIRPDSDETVEAFDNYLSGKTKVQNGAIMGDILAEDFFLNHANIKIPKTFLERFNDIVAKGDFDANKKHSVLIDKDGILDALNKIVYPIGTDQTIPFSEEDANWLGIEKVKVKALKRNIH